MKAHGLIRIAYVNHTGAVSGAEVVLMNMVRGLNRCVYEPVAICPPESDLARLLQSENIECLPLPPVQARFTWHPVKLWKSVISFTRTIFALRHALRRLNPEIIHANSLRAGIAVSLACVASRRKIVWHVHDNLPRHPLSTVIRMTALVLRPKRIIAVSHATAKAFRGPFSFTGKLLTVHNGVDLRRFPLKGSNRGAIRTALGMHRDAFLVCAVGQICARKGLLELIEAFITAHAEAPHMHLMIAGSVVFEHEQPYFEQLRKAAAGPSIAGSVSFIGQVQDVSRLLQAADLLVLNSREEPFGLVLIEAMSSGTPVLAARTGGIPEIVQDGDNGWLIDKADTAALAQKLLELSKSEEILKRVAWRAHNATCPQFSVERFQARIEDCYADLVENESREAGRAEWARPYQS